MHTVAIMQWLLNSLFLTIKHCSISDLATQLLKWQPRIQKNKNTNSRVLSIFTIMTIIYEIETHTHTRNRSYLYDLFLCLSPFNIQQHFQTKSPNQPLSNSKKITWFRLVTIPNVSFSFSSYSPHPSHNPIALPRKNACEKKFAICKSILSPHFTIVYMNNWLLTNYDQPQSFHFQSFWILIIALFIFRFHHAYDNYMTHAFPVSYCFSLFVAYLCLHTMQC